jgi:hypothetical protein
MAPGLAPAASRELSDSERDATALLCFLANQSAQSAAAAVPDSSEDDDDDAEEEEEDADYDMDEGEDGGRAQAALPAARALSRPPGGRRPSRTIRNPMQRLSAAR